MYVIHTENMHIPYCTHTCTSSSTTMYAHHFTALKCACNDQFHLSDCRHDGWMCTAVEDTGVCTTRVRLISNGTILRETKCLNTHLNPLHCYGSYNTDTDVWVCCSDRDYCNADLTPTLNLPAATTDTPPSSSAAFSTPTSSHIPHSSASPYQTMPAASSSPVVNSSPTRLTPSVQGSSQPYYIVYERSSISLAVVTPTLRISSPTPLPTPSGEQNWWCKVLDCMHGHGWRLKFSFIMEGLRTEVV